MTDQEFDKLLTLQEEGYSIATCVNRCIGNEIVSFNEEFRCIYTSNDEEGDSMEDFDLLDFIVFKNVTKEVLNEQ